MVKSGSFRPGKSGPSAPRGTAGRNGPSGRDSKNGSAHGNVGTNHGGGTGGAMPEGTAQWKPGSSGC